MENILLWMIGSMASGKSTQRRLICEGISGSKSFEVVDQSSLSNQRLIYSVYGPEVATIGEVTLTSQTDGLDKSFSKLKKEGGLASTEHCWENFPLTVLEGSQTSIRWFEHLSKIDAENDDLKLVIVHLTLIVTGKLSQQ